MGVLIHADMLFCHGCLGQKELTCIVEYLLQKLVSPSKT